MLLANSCFRRVLSKVFIGGDAFKVPWAQAWLHLGNKSLVFGYTATGYSQDTIVTSIVANCFFEILLKTINCTLSNNIKPTCFERNNLQWDLIVLYIDRDKISM